MSLYDDSPNENGDKMDSESYPSELKKHEVAEGNGKPEISEENQEEEVSRRLSKDCDISRSPSKERKSPHRSHSNDRKSRSRSKSRERGRSYSRSRSRSRGRRSHNKRRRSRSRSESPRSRRRRSRSRSRTPSEGARLHIAEIDVDTRKRDLEKAFEKYGTLREIWMARNPPCFAFAVFKHRRDAEDALRHTDGMMIGRCHIKVTMARPRVRGGRFRSFDQNLRCYQCGEVGHFSRNCTDTKFGYKRPQTPPRSRRHRSRSRSRGRRSRS